MQGEEQGCNNSGNVMSALLRTSTSTTLFLINPRVVLLLILVTREKGTIIGKWRYMQVNTNILFSSTSNPREKTTMLLLLLWRNIVDDRYCRLFLSFSSFLDLNSNCRFFLLCGDGEREREYLE
jgi:hypothetical protein